MSFREITGVARTSATLPAGAVYDTSPISIPVNQYKTITFHISYTRGAAGGAVTYKVEWSNDISVTSPQWFQMTEVQAPAIAAGSDVVDVTQRAEIRYQATGATVERFTSPTLAVSGKFVRIVMRESGVAGNPGTAAATFYMQGED